MATSEVNVVNGIINRPGSQYFPALDGLRAVSVSLVILVHVRQRSGWLGHVQGWLGVDIFLVLSGMLITYLLLKEEAETGDIALAPFYIRRSFRILPVYAVMLLVYLIVCHFDPIKWAAYLHALPNYLTFTNEFVQNGMPFSASWTVAIEEKFYLFWPILLVLVPRRGRRLTLIPVLMAGAALLPFRMARSYCDLLVGCLLAFLITSSRTVALQKILMRTPALVLVAAMVAGFVLVDRNEHYVFLFALPTAMLLGNLVLQPTWLSRLLGCNVFVWVGKRSYSIYLVQGLALDFSEHIIHPSSIWRQLTVAVLGTAVAAAIAGTMYRVVEEPARGYGRRMANRYKPRHAVMTRLDAEPVVDSAVEAMQAGPVSD